MSPPPATFGRRITRLAGRAGWNVGDQILSAVTNVALSFVVARAVDARGFGAFSVAFVIFTLVIGVERASVGQPLSMLHSDAEPGEMCSVIRAATGTSIALSTVIGCGAVLAGLVLSGALGPALITVGIVLPGLILQDCCRMIYFARRKPALAALNDGLWAVLQLAALGLLAASGVESVVCYILAWGGSAAVASGLALRQMRQWPDVRRSWEWMRGKARLSGYLLAEYLIGAGAYQSGIFLIGAFTGVASVGSLRAAQVLIGPASILATAVFTFALPELSGRRRISSQGRAKAAFAVSAAVAGATAIYGALLLAIPGAWGARLFGDTWSGASEVLLPVVVGAILLAAGLGGAVTAYSLGQAKLTFRLHCIEAPLLVASVIVGVHLNGVVGAAWGLSLTFAVMLPIWVHLTYRLLFSPTYARRMPVDGDAAAVGETVAVP